MMLSLGESQRSQIVQAKVPIACREGVLRQKVFDTTEVEIAEARSKDMRTVATWRPCTDDEVEFREFAGKLWYAPRCGPGTRAALTIAALEKISESIDAMEDGKRPKHVERIMAATQIFAAQPDPTLTEGSRAGRGWGSPFELRRAAREAQIVADRMRVVDGRIWAQTSGPVFRVSGSLYVQRISMCAPEEAYRYSDGVSALDHDALFGMMRQEDNQVHTDIGDLWIVDETALRTYQVDAMMAEAAARERLADFSYRTLSELGKLQEAILGLSKDVLDRTEELGIEEAALPGALLWCDGDRILEAEFVERLMAIRKQEPPFGDRNRRRDRVNWFDLQDVIRKDRILPSDLDLMSASFG